MDGLHVGRAFRYVRLRKGLRQADVAARAGVSQATYSMIERGHIEPLTSSVLERVARVLEIRLTFDLRWNGGELARMATARHSAMTETMTRRLLGLGWDVRAEVSFNHFGERGVVDLVARHPATGIVALIELKTELLDIGDLLLTMDRRGRLAGVIAASCGWSASEVGCFVVLAEGRTTRRRLAEHASVLRTAFPADGRAMRAWLRAPRGRMRGLAFLPDNSTGDGSQRISATKRVRRPSRGDRRA